MAQVDFNYNNENTIIQCNDDDTMKSIINKYLIKCDKTNQNLYFLYNGQILNEELTFNKCANNLDRSRKKINLIVLESQGEYDDSQMKKSKYIICPQCKEHANIYIDNFKIKIYGCKGEHESDELQLHEFEKTQDIDQSKIVCDKCSKLKSEVVDNIFFTCLSCKINLCPNCKESHDKSHCIVDYEQKMFYCDVHFKPYVYYCKDCKKDKCALCEDDNINHKRINYDNIIPDKETIKNDSKDTKEKIYELKTIIHKMIYKLNNLNKYLDNYFKIYDDIISNFDNEKNNYLSIQNISAIRKHNTEFLRYITEITNDNNFKTQFHNIIDIEDKMKFKQNKINLQNKINEVDIRTTNNDKNDDKIQRYNPLDDKYENFELNKIKILETFSTKYGIDKMIILNDRRILTRQFYYEENKMQKYKLCVYSVKKVFTCDINCESDYPQCLTQMDDNNLILVEGIPRTTLLILKIKKNSFEEIEKIENKDKIYSIQKLKNNKILIKYPNYFKIYSYSNSKLIDDNIIINTGDDTIYDYCQINENEIGISTDKKGTFFGTNDILIFYDIKNNKPIKTLKVGKGQNRGTLYLVNKDYLIVEGDNKMILVDVKSRNIKKEIKIEISPLRIENSIDNIICLNEKSFLMVISETIYQYEFNSSKTFELKEKRDIFNNLILKYPDNKLILVENKNNIIIYG